MPSPITRRTGLYGRLQIGNTTIADLIDASITVTRDVIDGSAINDTWAQPQGGRKHFSGSCKRYSRYNTENTFGSGLNRDETYTLTLYDLASGGKLLFSGSVFVTEVSLMMPNAGMIEHGLNWVGCDQPSTVNI